MNSSVPAGQSQRAESLRKLFAERIVILDGAMGTMIQQHKLDESAFRGERVSRTGRTTSRVATTSWC
jgi:5-methyltetrahydrofolate--homocysteine methyltransferase